MYAQTLTPIFVKIPRSAIITRWTYRKLTLLQKDIIASHETLQKDEVNTTPLKDRLTRKKIHNDKFAGTVVKPAKTLGIENNKQDDAEVKGFLKIVYMHKLILHFTYCD